MKHIYVGGDASKGYCDFVFHDQEGVVVAESDTFDDTPDGHAELTGILMNLRERFQEVTFHVGFESTGGLERNWLQLCSDLKQEVSLICYRINPKIIRRWKEWNLHPTSTDRISAKAIAEYIRNGLRPEETPFDPELEGLRSCARLLLKRIQHRRELKNEFQNLLVTVHPGLVQYCRGDLPRWVLKVIKAYPTVEALSGATPAKLEEIPFVTAERARTLIEEAKNSVASRRSKADGVSLKYLAEDLLELTEKIEVRKEQIYRHVNSLDGVEIMESIPGIGKWAASLLRLEIGDIFQYPDPESLVAQNGLDPVFDDSGDQTTQKGISKQGNAYVRAILFPCVQSAIQNNPPIRTFYEKLRGKGKEHMVAMVACMRKMVHIIYGCWTKGEEFDPGFEARLKKRLKQNKKKEESNATDQDKESDPNLDLSAPVSPKEAKRRKEILNKEKKDAQPQESVSSRKRGQGVQSKE